MGGRRRGRGPSTVQASGHLGKRLAIDWICCPVRQCNCVTVPPVDPHNEICIYDEEDDLYNYLADGVEQMSPLLSSVQSIYIAPTHRRPRPSPSKRVLTVFRVDERYL